MKEIKSILQFFKDGQSGIAAKSKKTYLTSDLPKARGIEFTAKDIETAVNKTLKMSSEKRKNIGKAARRQFYKERVEFLKKSYELTHTILPRRLNKWNK